MNVLLLIAHAIAEHDDLEMLSSLGYSVFAPGAYDDPAFPADDSRPALPDVPGHSDLVALCRAQREAHAGQSVDFGIVDWAKADLHPDLIAWADVIIAHHFIEAWVGAQWPRIRHKRVIWRTCGQSNPRLETEMRPLRDDGLQIVRYSPAERRGFEPLGVYAGEDALIRFGKDPREWSGWTGVDPVVGNLTQNLDIRGDHCGYAFWQAATAGLPVHLGGTGSDRIGGTGTLTYDGMRAYLRSLGVYLYMGTQPASYTLGLIEAMLTGVPVVSIGPAGMWMPDLFEGHELAGVWSDDPAEARALLRLILADRSAAESLSQAQRARAIELFDLAVVGPQWQTFLG